MNIRIDEGCNDELNVTAFFTDLLEIPKFESSFGSRNTIYSFINEADNEFSQPDNKNQGIFFYGKKEDFKNVLSYPEKYLPLFKKSSAVVFSENIYEHSTNDSIVNKLRIIYMIRTLERYFSCSFVRIIPWIPLFGKQNVSLKIDKESLTLSSLIKPKEIALPGYDLICNRLSYDEYMSAVNQIVSELHPSTVYIFNFSQREDFGECMSNSMMVYITLSENSKEHSDGNN